MSSDVRNSLKFGNIFRKDSLCTKMYKYGYREFDLSWHFKQHVPQITENLAKCSQDSYFLASHTFHKL